MIVVVIAVIAIAGYKYITRVDYSNPVSVATAFTKAMKAHNTSKASAYIAPAQAEDWLKAADDRIGSMKSGATEAYFERIPSDPAFAAPVTVAGKSVVVSADKSYSLGMSQVDGKWYVSTNP
jgi:hypothetical protein